MKLRGHHLFCTALFSGHGYDEAFTAAMTAAIKAMRDGEQLELLAGPDVLCAACPNCLETGGCALGTEDVLRRDGAAFAVLGLKAGEKLSWPQAQNLLSRITEEGFRKVCGGCRWKKEGLCSWETLSRRTRGGRLLHLPGICDKI